MEPRLWAKPMGFDSWEGLGIFLFAMSRPALEPTHSPIQCVLWALSLGVGDWGVGLTTRLHLVTRAEVHGPVPPLPNASSWGGA
jgi:hypothetical protein